MYTRRKGITPFDSASLAELNRLGSGTHTVGLVLANADLPCLGRPFLW